VTLIVILIIRKLIESVLKHDKDQNQNTGPSSVRLSAQSTTYR
jgi:hypothetical protein